jgi:hypothetical protein
LSGETTVVAIGDSAMWGTGTDYRFKPPNLVHKLLNNGTPMPPVQLRARGGAVIGRSNSSADGNFESSHDDYGYSEFMKESGGKIRQAYNDLDYEAQNDPDVDSKDINNLSWTIRRDIGRGWPTHLEQVDQFADWSPARNLDIPYKPPDSIIDHDSLRFYRDKSLPDPNDPKTGNKFMHEPSARPPNPDDVDLVLLNGGSNDIGLGYMMNFLDRNYYDLMVKIEQHCYRDMKHLLKKARDQFPNALLVLVGYPIFMSEWTSYQKGKKFLTSHSKLTKKYWVGKDDTHLLIERIIDGGLVFARAHQHYMRRAVAERAHAEVRQRDPGVMYVSRGFGVINAFEGPAPWGWSLDDDDTYSRRKHFIEEVTSDESDANPKVEFAGIGHPNRKGSIQTAKAIVNRYRDRGYLSVKETAGKMDRRTSVRTQTTRSSWSLKEALDSTRTFPNSFGKSGKGSVRNSLSHRYVDSIQLKFFVNHKLDDANDYQKTSRTNHLKAGADIFLDIKPGRNGQGETFRVDYESDLNATDTPQFDRHADESTRDRDGDSSSSTEIVTEVNIDPMAGRQMDSTVNTNYGRDRTSKEDNARDDSTGRDISWSSTDHGNTNDIPNDLSDYLPQNRWDTDRLMLWQVEEARIRVTNPGFWALQRVKLTINGELTWRTRNTDIGTLESTFKKGARKNWDTVEFDLLREI